MPEDFWSVIYLSYLVVSCLLRTKNCCSAGMLSFFSCVWLFVTLCTVAHHPPLSMGFPRQEYWSGLPFPLPRDLPNPEIKPASPTAPALAGRFLTTEPTGKPKFCYFNLFFEAYAFNSLSSSCFFLNDISPIILGEEIPLGWNTECDICPASVRINC